MTLTTLKERLEEAKKASHKANSEARRAAVAASLIKGRINRAEHSLPNKVYAEYGWACTLREELKAAAEESLKAVRDAQWYVHLVAAREMAMFDGEDEI